MKNNLSAPLIAGCQQLRNQCCDIRLLGIRDGEKQEGATRSIIARLGLLPGLPLRRKQFLPILLIFCLLAEVLQAQTGSITIFKDLLPADEAQSFPFTITNTAGGTTINSSFNLRNAPTTGYNFNDIGINNLGNLVASNSAGGTFRKASNSSLWTGPGSGSITSLDVAPSDRHYVVVTGNVYESGVGNLTYTQSSNNGNFTDVGAGANGSIFGVSNGHVVKWPGIAGVNSAWSNINPAVTDAARIDVLPDGNPVYVSTTGSLMYSADGGLTYAPIATNVTEVAASPDGTLWIVKSESPSIIQHGTVSGSFATVSGISDVKRLTVDPRGFPLVLNTPGLLYTYNGSTWVNIEYPTSATLTVPSNVSSFHQLAPGTYRVTEGLLPDGYSINDIKIAGTGSVVKNIPGKYADITIAAGQEAFVTFVNTKQQACNELIGTWTNSNWGGSGNNFNQVNTETFPTSTLSQNITGWTKQGTGLNGVMQLNLNVGWSNGIGFPNVSYGFALIIRVGGIEYARIASDNANGDIATATYSNGASGNLASVNTTSYAIGPFVPWIITLPAFSTPTQQLQIVCQRNPGFVAGNAADDVGINSMSIRACDGSAAITVAKDMVPDQTVDYGFILEGGLAGAPVTYPFALQNNGTQLPAGVALSDIGINKLGNIYVTTSTGRMFKKRTTQTQWEEPAPAITNFVSVDATSSDYVYYASNATVQPAFKSDNYGGAGTYTQLNTSAPGGHNSFLDIGTGSAGNVFAVGSIVNVGGNRILRYGGNPGNWTQPGAITNAARIDVLPNGSPVFAGTNGGVGISSDGGVTYTFPSIGVNNLANDIAAGPDGSIWITKTDGTVAKKASATVGNFTNVALTGLVGIPSRISIDPTGNPYVITATGLFYFNGTEWTPVEFRTGNSNANTAIFAGISPGTYTIKESALPVGYSLNDITFTTGVNPGTTPPVVTVDNATRTATVTIGNAQEVFLKFTNLPGTNTTNAVNDINQTPAGVAVSGNIKTNDTDPEGNTQTLTSYQYDSNGDGTPDASGTFGTSQVVGGVDANGNPVANAGTLTLNVNGTYTFTPAAGFTGAITAQYTTCDNGTPQACDIASLTIEVRGDTPGVNDPPIAQNDHASTEVNTPVSSNVLGNDSDPDGDTLTVTQTHFDTDGDGIADDPIAVGTATPVYGKDINGNIVPAGILVINANGTYTFTPNATFTGTVNADYTISDGHGGTDSAVLTIDVNPDNGNSTYANDDANTSPQGVLQTGDVLDNDTDPEGNTQTVTGGAMSNGNPVTVGTASVLPNGGSLTLNPDGTYIYTPVPGFVGTEVVTYTKCDNGTPIACATATLYLTTLYKDTPPVAVDDTASTQINTPVSGSLATNDTCGNTPCSYNPTPATPPTNGTVTINPDGSYTYTPGTGFVGTDTFSYVVCDVDGDCDTAQVVITVDGPPVAVDDTISTQINTPVSGSLATNDTCGNTPCSYNPTPATPPTNGTVTINPDGSYTYTPGTGFVGTDTFSYVVCDVDGDCDTAQVVITVDGPPVAVDDTTSTQINTPVSGSLATNDECGNSPCSYNPTPATPPTNGTVTINPDGSYTYTPGADFVGTDTFSYVVCDVDGDCDTAQVVITVDGPPVAVDDTASTQINTPVSGSLATNDTCGNSPCSYNPTPATPPINGTVTINPDGSYTYTPGTDFVGTDTFSYVVCDVDGDCDTAQVVITVDGPPVAVDDTASTQINTPVSGSLATNDTCGNSPCSYNPTPATPPTNGTVTINPDGSYTYTPGADFVGTDTFSYVVCDADGDCDTAQVVVTVDGHPIAVDDTTSTQINAPVSGSLATNDTCGNSPCSYNPTPATPPTNGTVTINPDGSYTYTPGTGFVGTDTFSYVVCDADGDCDTAQVVVTVDGHPIAVDDTTSTQINAPVSGSLATNDTCGNSPCSYNPTPATPPTNGTVTINPDGSYTYTPGTGFVGTDTFSYVVCDADGDCDTAQVVITVDGHPVAVDDTASTQVNTPVSGSLATNDTCGNAPCSYDPTPVTPPTNGTVTINHDGSYTYTPSTGFVGTDTFSYVVCDVDGDCDTAQVVITVITDGTGLPVDLIYLAAKREADCDVVLSWITGVETNFNYFGIEWGIDGESFEAVDFVTAKGSGSSYSYPYVHGVKGMNYFRLLLMDRDGRHTYSQVIQVNIDCVPDRNIKVYPTVSDKYINMTGLLRGESVLIYDMKGNVVLQMKTEGSRATLDLSAVAQGNYIVALITLTGERMHYKIVKK